MTFLKNCLPATLFLAMILTVSAATKYVWTNSASPGGPYSTWDTAAHDIQSAITNATDGDTVIVTDGVYNVAGHIDAGVFRAVSGTWHVWLSGAGYNRVGPFTFATTDVHLAVPADYDGDKNAIRQLTSLPLANGACGCPSPITALRKWNCDNEVKKP